MKISKQFIEKFKERQHQNEGLKIKEKTKKHDIIDKEKFAEKLEQLQQDIELRNKIQD